MRIGQDTDRSPGESCSHRVPMTKVEVVAPVPAATLSARRRPGKRAFDLVLAVPLALLTTPLILLLALGSAIAFRANPFFRQQRVGWGGRPFTCTKLRTLPAHAPHNADRPTIEDHVEGWWGKVLRRSHFDELPQLWHVVEGTMSLVGPRPVIREHSDSFDPAFVARRLLVRPGVTGLWQVGLHKHRPIGEHPEYDLYYVEHQSLRLDLWVIVTTVKLMVFHQAAKPLESVPGWDDGSAH